MSRELVELLVIEDDRVFAEKVKIFLEDAARFDYRVTVVNTFAAAILQLRTRSFGAILLDLILPNGQGLELVQKIRRILPFAPLSVVTSLTSDSIEEDALRENASEFMFKNEINDPKDLQRMLWKARARHGHEAIIKPVNDIIDRIDDKLEQAKSDIALEKKKTDSSRPG